MKDPAVPLYTADFIIGCTPMTWEQRGKYIFLLCYQQQLGHMSLETMTGIVGEIPPIIMRKFIKDEEGLYYNERMEEEVNKRARYKEKQAQNSQRRWGNNPNLIPDDIPDSSQTLSQSDAKTMPLDNDNDNENNNKRGIGKKSKSFTPPSLDEVISYFKQNGYKTEAAMKAHKYYTEMNWHDSTGKAIKSWKGKMVAVWFKDENKDFAERRGVVDLDRLNQERGKYNG